MTPALLNLEMARRAGRLISTGLARNFDWGTQNRNVCVSLV